MSETAGALSPQTVATKLGDACRSRVRRELARQRRPDSSALVLVCDRERDLGPRPVPHDPRDADRLRVVVEVAHEHVVLGVDPREKAKLVC